jgi:histidine triad (HIT) family protein
MTHATDGTDCDFCAIAQGHDASAEIVCEEEAWVACFPLKPATPGHTLIIPRAHVEDLWQVEPPLGAELMRAVVRVGRAIGAALAPRGMNLITSAGASAEQTVFHLHLHLVPRWPQDDFGPIWPIAGKTYEDDTIEAAAELVRAACAADHT